MLKHASNAGAGPAVNISQQLRNNLTVATATATTTQQQQQQQQTGTATARSIHLRPQQPLNVSTLSAASLQSTPAALAAVNTTATTAAAAATNCSTSNSNNNNNNANTTLNGGQRIALATAAATITPLLNIAPLVPGATSAATTATTTPITPPITSNGGPNHHQHQHHHTYTNQHMLTASSNVNNHNNTSGNSNSNNNNNNNNNATNHNQNNYSNCNNLTSGGGGAGVPIKQSKHGPGPREALTSLGLLCLVSLLLALLSLIFLLKISPNGREEAALSRPPHEDFVIVYDVTLALCALSLSLNLCCLLVCAIQFLFAVKLVRSPMFDGRDNKYLEKSSVSRTCAVGGFFISIPIFLTGIILYTFNHFHSTPAIITSVLIGVGIVFCGGAMVHNVFVWQKEKTISYRSPPLNMSMASHIASPTSPLHFLNHASYHQHLPLPPQSANGNLLHTQSQSAAPQHQHHFNFNHLQPTSVTPVSPNHSHGSFNHASFLLRPSTATPPTPKPPLPMPNGCISTLTSGGGGGGSGAMVPREASGSVSPGIPATLDISNITSPSLHELSTLV